MREILSIQLGQIGNNIGNHFWNSIADDFSIEYDRIHYGYEDYQLDKTHIFFRETKNNTFIPRSLVVDLDDKYIESFQNQPIGKFHHEDNIIYGQASAFCIWARGMYTEGAELMEYMNDTFRQQLELADSPQGVQIFQSLLGGTGSGMGCLFLQTIKDQFPELLVTTQSLLEQNLNHYNQVLQPYNIGLSMQYLYEQCDMSVFYALEQINNFFDNQQAQIGKEIANQMQSYYIPTQGQLITNNCQSMQQNLQELVPYERLHFLLPQNIEFSCQNINDYNQIPILKFNNQKLGFQQIDLKIGKIISVQMEIRGNTQQIFSNNYNQQKQFIFNDYNIDQNFNFKQNIYSQNKINVLYQKNTGLINSSSIKLVFNKHFQQFLTIFRRKAFLTNFLAEGMDEMEFQESQEIFKQIIQQYEDI